ncbi:GNAT family N-acetyltransferase [Streptomyces tremellae]|uniref:GNAT family N-acetyltransferase n=1 Tax=Streptomyces tremellae TaxID=1124239 RepID=A0ABP7G5M1_9ACTN
MNSRVTIYPAGSSDAQTIASMWGETSEWLAARGIDQWQYPASMEKIARDIDRGTAYLVREQDALIGTITVDESADAEFWRPDDLPEDALYGHRIIVLPSAQGNAVGTALLDWASRKAERLGKSWLRVDAWKTNAALGSYYERQGFEHVRTVDLPHRRSGALYQRRAGVVMGSGPEYLGLEELVPEDRGF